MNKKKRIEKIENQVKPKVKLTWRNLIDWANGDRSMPSEVANEAERVWAEIVHKSKMESEQVKERQMQPEKSLNSFRNRRDNFRPKINELP